MLVAIAAATTMTAFAQGSGADTYKAKCAMCHGADGLGATPAGKAMKATSFKSPESNKEWKGKDAGLHRQAYRPADQGCSRLRAHVAEVVDAAESPVAGSIGFRRV